jgi:hypothetical protein
VQPDHGGAERADHEERVAPRQHLSAAVGSACSAGVGFFGRGFVDRHRQRRPPVLKLLKEVTHEATDVGKR